MIGICVDDPQHGADRCLFCNSQWAVGDRYPLPRCCHLMRHSTNFTFVLWQRFQENIALLFPRGDTGHGWGVMAVNTIATQDALAGHGGNGITFAPLYIYPPVSPVSPVSPVRDGMQQQRLL